MQRNPMTVLGKQSNFLGQDTSTNLSCSNLLLTHYTDSPSENELSLHRSTIVSRDFGSVQGVKHFPSSSRYGGGAGGMRLNCSCRNNFNSWISGFGCSLKSLKSCIFITLFQFVYVVSAHIFYISISRKMHIDILGRHKKDQFQTGETDLFYYRWVHVIQSMKVLKVKRQIPLLRNDSQGILLHEFATWISNYGFFQWAHLPAWS